METKNVQEAFIESAKVAEKWVNEANSTMAEIYNKQINLASGFYNTFFNSMLGMNPHAKNTELDFSDFLSGDNNRGQASANGSNAAMFNPFLFLSFSNKAYKQMFDNSLNLLTLITKQQENGQSDWGTIIQKYNESLDAQFEALKNIQQVYFDSRYSLMDISLKANKNMLAEMNNQFNFFSTQAKNFLAGILKSYANPAVKKEDVFAATPVPQNGAKKPAKVAVN
jgi:hypothetical protein